jgi:UDP-N-acetylglucosamine--N-acetylmuramyl-(pentapeptide) pyrophosphoryl-undecaprenol N-acetylglucosamine transferase
MAIAHPELSDFFRRRIRAGVRLEITGLPLRQSVAAARRDSAAQALGLDASLTTLLVLGGSLGSQRINDALLGALKRPEFQSGPLEGIQVLHVTGRRYSSPESGSRHLPRRYCALPYLDEHYADALAAADLVVSRAGASTVAEITARGIPAVLIPWSQATTGEQTRNAEPLALAGAAVVIADEDLTPERLAEVLSELLSDRGKRAAMAEASASLGRPEAAASVAQLALALVYRKQT